MKTRLLLITAITAAISSFGQQSGAGNSSQPQYRIVNRFESRGEVALQAFLRLGSETKIPLGIVNAGDQLCKTKTEIAVEGETIANVVDKLTTQVGGYHWTLEDGVLLLLPQPMPRSALQLLNTLLPRFAAPRTTLDGLGVFLRIDVLAVFRPDIGTAGGLPRSPDAVLVGPLEIDNVTVEQTLNLIVKQGSTGQWILHPIPDDYRTAADKEFVDIVDYGSDPISTIQRLSCTP